MAVRKKKVAKKKVIKKKIHNNNKTSVGQINPHLHTDLSVTLKKNSVSDGSSGSYYIFEPGSKELQDVISDKNMNAQIGEIFRSCMRYGEASHSDQLRDAKKIQFYINAEIARLKKAKAKRIFDNM